MTSPWTLRLENSKADGQQLNGKNFWKTLDISNFSQHYIQATAAGLKPYRLVRRWSG